MSELFGCKFSFLQCYTAKLVCCPVVSRYFKINLSIFSTLDMLEVEVEDTHAVTRNRNHLESFLSMIFKRRW